ncbi:separin [Nothobranchius furzeri]|uniref:separase n=7 Tax=Nothobranchius TaxID=28779 RepID=A0A9D2XRG1_NOTFU|nr:separase [Nothobranchius furzeri]
MKCLKVDEYIKRTASVKETELLYQELETHILSKPGLQGRTLCDRVIRACNHHLGVGSCPLGHIKALVNLVELSLRGYDVSAELVAQTSPFYMEKIIFHIVKKLSSLEVHTLCSQVAGLLYKRLSTAQQAQDDFHVLVRSCFSVLWTGLSASKDKKILNPQDKLHCQFQALSFLLLDTEKAVPTSKALMYTYDAITEFEDGCGTVTPDDASFLLQEVQTLFNTCFSSVQNCEQGTFRQPMEASSFYVFSEMALLAVKALCKASHHGLASTLLDETEKMIFDRVGSKCMPLVLATWGIEIHSALTAGKECSRVLMECARVLRSLSADLGKGEGQAALEGGNLVIWAVESGHSKGLSGPELLALFSFLEEYQEWIMKMQKKSLMCQAESSRLQQVLCVSIYQGFLFAYESMLASQLEDRDTLDRVLLYCQSTAGLLMTELHKAPNENLLNKTVTAVSNVACGLYNRRLYEQAFSLVEILCRSLCKNHPVSLTADRLSRPFMLAVQTSRRAEALDRALKWVILWLKALGDQVMAHMAEPVSLWVKTKSDAARNDDEDIRLRTLRDGFGPDVPEEKFMLCLLEEELRAYKELARDTTQERYNTLCDLLDICHAESSHTHLRAVYLCEMAQVVCFQDFREQTDCMAVDFTHEALRLLEEEPEVLENADKLKDDKAHALLWLYICTLEQNLQEAIENDRKRRELHEKTSCVSNLVGNNDFDYEDKQKTQDSLVYEGLQFNMAAEDKACLPLERALNEWTSLFTNGSLAAVRNAKQTCSSISTAAALFRLTGKPLKALEAYQLGVKFSRELADVRSCASALCQSANILLDLGSPELALAQIEAAEQILTSDASDDEPSSLSMMLVLLKAQYYFSTGQVDHGVPHLCEVLKVSEQRQSKSWYLLRARTLQACSCYLNLDVALLPKTKRSLITQHGINTPDSALYESLKLLCSLLVTLVGKGLYGTQGSNSDVRFVHQGDNLMLKWQLLSELLNCAKKMVAVRSSCGAINDARLQCLEALKLAIKLQTLSQCAELLVMKAELELMHGEREESKSDLNIVRNLLESCTDFSAQVQRTDVKIKPRKGCPVQRARSPPPTLDDDLKEILSTRWITKEAVMEDVANSPPLKALPLHSLSSLTHEPSCAFPCCSEPSLARVTARWAATQADLVLQLDPSDLSASSKLYRATLIRCNCVTLRLKEQLAKLFPPCISAGEVSKPSLMQDMVARVYLSMAVTGLQTKPKKISGLWKTLEAGLVFVDSTTSPVLRPFKAGLMATKAIASLMILASKEGCSPMELFSDAWSWNAPKEFITDQKSVPPSSVLKKTTKNSNPDRKKEKKRVKAVKPKIYITSTSTKEKSLVPMTPITTKSPRGDLGTFDFNTIVPTLAFTPVQKVKCPASVQKASRTASKLQFNVYEELSPDQYKGQPVPAAPKRPNKSRFKVEFSDESDLEPSSQAELKVKADATKKQPSRRGGRGAKAAADPPAEKIPLKRQTKGRKNTSGPPASSSEDDQTLPRQPTSTRRPRTRKQQAEEPLEEPDTMRTIVEETNEVLDISTEKLRTSDTEAEDYSASNVDFEVLRRDLCCDLERGKPFSPRSKDHQTEDRTLISRSDNKLGDLSPEDIRSLLCSALLTLQHFPCPTTYPLLCGLLALTMGQRNPTGTAMLHAESLGVTSRHRTIRHLGSSLLKLKKASSDLSDQLESLSLSWSSRDVSAGSTEQRLSQMENMFSFPMSDPTSFPQNQSQEFMQKIQHLPPGVTVCLMSVLGVKPGEMGESIILSRLGKDSPPITVHISTCRQQLNIRRLVQEMENILVEQKVVSCVAEKAKWWEGRRALDARVEQLLREMEESLGCWKSFLLPLSEDPELSLEAQELCKAFSSRRVTVNEQMLKVILSASHELSSEDLRAFARGSSPHWDVDCDQILRVAKSKFSGRNETRGHLVLILDKYLQKLPWESMAVLKSHSVSRMPSWHSVLGLSFQKEMDSQSILRHGVDTSNVFYVLDPDANLKNAQDRFKEWFCSKPDWEGVCGVAPDPGQLEGAVATKDLYIYVGHGAGARFLDGQSVLKRQMRAASLLFGCSSAALAVRGNQEGQGIILNYLIAGCPFILGNLWDVTDRDIDRFTKALLESWLSAGPGAALLDHMSSSRQATHLKYLIGAAPVTYGLPVHLL